MSKISEIAVQLPTHMEVSLDLLKYLSSPSDYTLELIPIEVTGGFGLTFNKLKFTFINSLYPVSQQIQTAIHERIHAYAYKFKKKGFFLDEAQIRNMAKIIARSVSNLDPISVFTEGIKL